MYVSRDQQRVRAYKQNFSQMSFSRLFQIIMKDNAAGKENTFGLPVEQAL